MYTHTWTQTNTYSSICTFISSIWNVGLLAASVAQQLCIKCAISAGMSSGSSGRNAGCRHKSPTPAKIWKFECVYVFVCVCMYACVYVFILLCSWYAHAIHLHTHMYIPRAHTHTHIHIHIPRACTDTHIHTYTYTHKHTWSADMPL